MDNQANIFRWTNQALFTQELQISIKTQDRIFENTYTHFVSLNLIEIIISQRIFRETLHANRIPNRN